MAAERLGGVAQVLRHAGQELAGNDQSTLAQYTDSLASQIDNFSNTLRDREIGSLLEDAKQLAYRQPEWFVAGALAAGFALGRFFKSSRMRSQQNGYQYGYQGRNQYNSRGDQRSYGQGYDQSYGQSYGQNYGQSYGDQYSRGGSEYDRQYDPGQYRPQSGGQYDEQYRSGYSSQYGTSSDRSSGQRSGEQWSNAGGVTGSGQRTTQGVGNANPGPNQREGQSDKGESK